jgi:hypothetical protein
LAAWSLHDDAASEGARRVKATIDELFARTVPLARDFVRTQQQL